MQSFRVVNLLDEHGQAGRHVGEGLVSGPVDFFNFQRFHEAFGLCVVIGVSDAAHRTAQTCGLKGITVGLRCVLAAPVCMMKTAFGRVSVGHG